MVKIQKKAEEAIALLEAQAYQISKNDASQKHMIRSTKESLAKVGEQFEILDEQTKTKEEKEIAEKIAEAELTSAYSFITNITQKQVKYLQRAVKKGTDNSYHFSAEEEAVYTTLTNQFDKLILPPLIRNLEEKSFKSRAEERILEEARKVSKSILDLKGDVGNLEKSSEDHLVELLARRLGLDDEKKKFVRTKLQEQQKETNWFFMNFGTLMHSSNIYLNSVGHVITRTKDEEVVGTMKQVQPFLEKLNRY